jgi:glyceraldehyde 3-phosphate dehydrogenase
MRLDADGKPIYKVFTWYDNEYSYVHQLVRTIVYFGNLK